jgi:hypothetical protein
VALRRRWPPPPPRGGRLRRRRPWATAAASRGPAAEAATLARGSKNPVCKGLQTIVRIERMLENAGFVEIASAQFLAGNPMVLQMHAWFPQKINHKLDELRIAANLRRTPSVIPSLSKHVSLSLSLSLSFSLNLISSPSLSQRFSAPTAPAARAFRASRGP